MAEVINNMSTVGATLSTSASATSTSVSPSASTDSSSGSGFTAGGPGSFYKNLFYILIGLLCAFGLVSFLSLLRARRRRAAIITEAQRLGVLVPGVEGYIPMRERQHISWARSDGTEQPDWWEVKGKEKVGDVDGGDGMGAIAPNVNANGLSLGDLLEEGEKEFHPLAIIPPATQYTAPPIPHSALPYFPNHLAYRPSSLLPPPSRYQADQPETLNDLAGEQMDFVTIIRMPGHEWPEGREVPEGEEVLREWAGVELGVGRAEVVSGRAR